jgi:putative ABC transport system permease protein
VANVIAIPLSLWGMRSWLEGFAYRIELTPDIFVAAAGLAFLIAMGTVASQALRAANTDPSRALRYE